ncbi:MAG: hypothetical protein U5L45_11500 [Saprospiraceae bacterium]|nr:hypothetical protein [Saprospiraceae bacterium]
MKQFTFEQKQKNVLLGFMALGAISLIASYFIDPTLQYSPTTHTRFWTNLLQNSAFFTLISFTAIFATAATLTMYAGWHTAFKRIWEAMGMFLPVGLGGLAIVGIGSMMHLHHIYHWADAKAVAEDKILLGKSGFLNFGFYFTAILGFGGAWYFFMRKFRALSLAQDSAPNDKSYSAYENVKVWAAAFLPIAGFTSAAAIWLWIMSIDAHWYSTMFAWYTTASAWVTCVAITILLLVYFKNRGLFPWVTSEHLHDLGKLLFAFSIFWTYLWFSQYMLIWYANIGEETIYFRQRLGEFPVLFYGNLVLNFILPFLVLVRNDTKRKFGTLTFASILIVIGHWWDYFQMVKIGPYKSILDHHAAGHGATGAAHGAEGHAATAAHGAEYAVGTAAQAVTHGVEHAAGTAAQAVTHGAEHATTTAAHAAETVAHGAEQVAKAVIETPALDALAKMNADNYFHYTQDLTAGFGLPGFLEIFTFLGFGALFVYFVFNQLTKASLIPESDPYLEETLNHHT